MLYKDINVAPFQLGRGVRRKIASDKNVMFTERA
jgi:hypothetical protein